MLVLPRAILFDMDGTLTRPHLDFDAMKAAMGIGDRPILEALEELTPEHRQRALHILHDFERRAADECELNSGCDDLLSWIRGHSIRMAIITRNSRQSVATVLAKHRLAFDVLITREDPPYKPDPAPLLLALKKLSTQNSPPSTSDVWMVGDGEYDVQAAAAANIRSVWISHNQPKWFPQEPWRTVVTLHDLLGLLQSCSRRAPQRV